MFGRSKASKIAPELVASTSPLTPGAPVDIILPAAHNEIYVWPRNSRRSVLDASQDAPGIPMVGMIWQTTKAETVHVTLDVPPLLDLEVEPAWELPREADELALITFEGTVLARVPVPYGFIEIYTAVKRNGVAPRAVIYLVPA